MTDDLFDSVCCKICKLCHTNNLKNSMNVAVCYLFHEAGYEVAER